MAEHPVPGERPRARDMILRTLPDRLPASSWCGLHEKARTRTVGRAAWVCLDCVREQSREPQ
jgi:hypothetical protein